MACQPNRTHHTGYMSLHVAWDQPCLLSSVSADNEYLHKERDGNVFLHNAATTEESLYLSNSTFVISTFIFRFGSFLIIFDTNVSILTCHRLKWMPQVICCQVITNMSLLKAISQRWETCKCLIENHLRCSLQTESGSLKTRFVFAIQQKWRHSYTASYSIYNRESS